MKATFYQIEKGVPLRESHQRSPVRTVLLKLNVGDSFLAPLNHRANVHRLAEMIGIKVTTRAEKGAMRVWRIKK